MATYTFETITDAQALAFTSNDTLVVFEFMEDAQ